MVSASRPTEWLIITMSACTTATPSRAPRLTHSARSPSRLASASSSMLSPWSWLWAWRPRGHQAPDATVVRVGVSLAVSGRAAWSRRRAQPGPVAMRSIGVRSPGSVDVPLGGIVSSHAHDAMLSRPYHREFDRVSG